MYVGISVFVSIPILEPDGTINEQRKEKNNEEIKEESINNVIRSTSILHLLSLSNIFI